MRHFRVIVHNPGEIPVTACVYRRTQWWNAPLIAWEAALATSGADGIFAWTDYWQFVWTKTSTLAPGTLLEPGELLYADPRSGNQVTLRFSEEDSRFAFTGQHAVSPPDRFTIDADGALPPQQVAAGLAIGGQLVTVVPILPAMKYVFAAPDQVWIALGDVRRGQVLGDNLVTDDVQIVFPPNTVSMTATLNHDRSWSIAPTPL